MKGKKVKKRFKSEGIAVVDHEFMDGARSLCLDGSKEVSARIHRRWARLRGLLEELGEFRR